MEEIALKCTVSKQAAAISFGFDGRLQQHSVSVGLDGTVRLVGVSTVPSCRCTAASQDTMVSGQSSVTWPAHNKDADPM